MVAITSSAYRRMRRRNLNRPNTLRRHPSIAAVIAIIAAIAHIAHIAGVARIAGTARTAGRRPPHPAVSPHRSS
jgi:hypothetical protein